jgi:cellulose 1,4-beta-cellobiosidase
MNRTFGYRAAIFTIAVIALFGPAAMAATVTDCTITGTTSINGGAYIYQQNEWNSTLQQCATIDNVTGNFTLSTANFNTTGGAPATYPSIFKGCHWGLCSSGSGLPIQISQLGSATSSWSTTQPASGAYDVAYDIWTNTTPTTIGQPDGSEIMIWLNSRGGVSPFGGQVASNVSIAGKTWNVWTGRQSSWNIISYVLTPGGTSVSGLDIKALIQDSVNRGSTNAAWYLIDAEAGFEVWQGGQGLASSGFSFSASTGVGATATATTAARPTATATTAATATATARAAATATATSNGGTGACSPVDATITSPFSFDGAGPKCWKTNSLGAFINIWNTTKVTINGVDITNVYTACGSYPAKLSDGFWYISYSSASFGHLETSGTPCAGGATATATVRPTATPTSGATATATTRPTATSTATATTRATATSTAVATATATATTRATATATATSNGGAGACSPVDATITSPFSFDGAGPKCWKTNSLGGFINIWNTTKVTINGVDITNVYTACGSYPAKLSDGFWYISYSSASFGHFETSGTACAGGGATATATSGATATATPRPTATPTSGGTATATTRPTATPTGAVTATPTPTNPPQGTHLDNPFVGASIYLNVDYVSEVTTAGNTIGGTLGAKMKQVANFPTFIWLDSIDAVNGTNGYARSLAGHLDQAVAQGRNAVELVIYDLPNRDCSALASNGELLIAQNGFNRYKTEYIDNIATVLASKPAYANLRIIAVVEPDSLPNLVTNVNAFAKCQEANGAGGYVDSIRYALNRLSAFSNFYGYIDIGHHGWLGWDTNFNPAITLIANCIKGTTKGVGSISGFISDTANTTALNEVWMTANQTISGNPVRSANYHQWNVYIDETTYDIAWRNAMIAQGFPTTIGMVVDTSRNGWGGTARPTGPSTSTDLNTFVDAGRIDRRIHKGNWCNQKGAGIGQRPTVNPQAGFHAYVWVKPPGESDGSSSLIPTGPDNPGGKGFDPMCDPNYHGNSLNGNSLTGAWPNAPVSGRWFEPQFEELVTNAFPAFQ